MTDETTTNQPATKDGLPYIGDLGDDNANWMSRMQRRRDAGLPLSRDESGEPLPLDQPEPDEE